jgi:hypothetical protein
LAKDKQSQRIDSIVALGMAALAAVQFRGLPAPARFLDFWTFEEYKPVTTTAFRWATSSRRRRRPIRNC